MPPNGNPDFATNIYNNWKERYIIYHSQEASANDLPGAENAARVMWDSRPFTVSEGIGYGMLNAFFAGDYDLVNQLFHYSVIMRQDGLRLMPWKTRYFQKAEDRTSATDADLDIATALVLLYAVTGNEQFKASALEVIEDIWTWEILPANLMIRPANAGFGGQHNLSYFAPIALRLFAWVDPAHDWMGVLNVGYEYMALVQSRGNGLVADWTSTDGYPVVPANNAQSTNYNRFGMESLRVPWRLAWDYHWTGEPRAKAILDQMSNYIVTTTGGDPSQARKSYPYELNDASEPDNLWNSHTKIHVGAVGTVCAMNFTNPDQLVFMDQCTAILNTNMNTLIDYYPDILQVIYSQLLNGLYQKPPAIPF
ncbi:MAG: hypothetical protein GX801_07030 [Fibrobacter sp.]|nr:hypothetical protein [Fibrobacter sp.]